MKVISLRENTEYKDQIILYLQKSWSEVLPEIYSDCLNHTINAKNPLPNWYALIKNNEIIGCVGLSTNDFISRMDLYPWLVALFIDENHRGHSYASILINKIKEDTAHLGFDSLYLCTEHIGYYEKYGFTYIGNGYHPWGEQSRIYEINL